MENINWYPGHMAKAIRKMREDLKIINIVIEIIDARIPISSRNPDFDELFKDKIRVIILNKSDLADPQITKQWIAWFAENGIDAIAFSTVKDNKKTITNLIDKAALPIIERYQAKGINKTIRCMVSGIPNVGKSAFINRVFGKSKAKTEDRPGVTRSNQWIKINQYLELMDTPGVLWPKFEDQKMARNLSFVGSIRDQILDTVELSGALLEKLSISYPDSIKARYGIEICENGYEMLEEICKKRGFIFKKDDFDYERGATAVLTEFREGILGRISLEVPGES